MAIDANSQVNRGFSRVRRGPLAPLRRRWRNRRDRRRGATSGSGQGRLHPGASRADAGARDGALPDEPDVMTVEDPGSDFMVDVLKKLDSSHRRQPGIELQRPSRIVHQLRRHTAPEWITCCHEQASVNIANGYYAVAGKPMAVITFAPSGLHHAMMGIFGAFSAHTPTYLRREHPRRQRAATRVRLGPAFRGRSGCCGPRHGEVGRHTVVAAALCRVGRARLQDGDDRATRARCSSLTPHQENAVADRSKPASPD